MSSARPPGAHGRPRARPARRWRAVVAPVVLLVASCAGPTQRDAAPAPTTLAGRSTTDTATATTTPATTTTSAVNATTTTASAPVVAPTGAFPADRPLRVLIVGDSVAASLAGSGPRESVELAGGIVEVDNVAGVACPVIFAGGWWFTDGSTIENPTCDRPDRYDDVIATFRPDVVLSMFGWPGVGGGQRFPDGSVAVPCEVSFDRAWSDGYRDLVARLSPYARVVVSTVAPVSMDPRRPEPGCLNDLVRQLPAEVFDLQQWLCPALDCSVRSQLRADGVHFADDPVLRRAALVGILTELVAAS